MAERRSLRSSADEGTDLLGVYVIAGTLALLSLAEEDARIAAAAGGAVAGSVLGLALRALRR